MGQTCLSDQLGKAVVGSGVTADIGVVPLHRRHLLVVEARAMTAEGFVPRVGAVVTHDVEEGVVLFVHVKLWEGVRVRCQDQLCGRVRGVYWAGLCA